MKKEISITDRPEKLAGYEAEQYFAACGNLSWYDFVTAMPASCPAVGAKNPKRP